MKRLIFIFIILSVFTYAAEYEVIDVHGKVHKLNKSYKRIISLYPAHTEILKEIGAVSKVVGSTADRGSKLEEGMVEFKLGDSVEKYLSLRPDLVLVRPMVENKYENLIAVLKSRGVEVISLHPKTSSELEGYWKAIGQLSGETEGASRYIGDFHSRLEELKKKDTAVRKKVFFEARYNRGIYTNAKNSIASWVLETSGVDNIFEEESPTGSTIIPIKHEKLLSKGDDIDIYIAQKGTMNRRSYKDIDRSSGYQLIKAVRNGMIIILDEKVMSRPTSKILDAVEEIKKYQEDNLGVIER